MGKEIKIETIMEIGTGIGVKRVMVTGDERMTTRKRGAGMIHYEVVILSRG